MLKTYLEALDDPNAMTIFSSRIDGALLIFVLSPEGA